MYVCVWCVCVCFLTYLHDYKLDVSIEKYTFHKTFQADLKKILYEFRFYTDLFAGI